MDFVILAAGRGLRLRPATDDRPKCLLEVGGRTILDRQFEALATRSDITSVRLVAGYRYAEVSLVAQAVARRLPLTVIANPHYGVTDSLYSLWLALRRPSTDFAVVNGDTVFGPELLDRVAGRGTPPSLARLIVSRRDVIRDDAVKVVAPDGSLERIGKEIPSCDATGESVGLARFTGAGAGRVARLVNEMVAEPQGMKLQWNRLFKRLLEAGESVKVSHCEPHEWVEVDRQADLDEAQRALATSVAARLA
jgi:choline kinase